MLLSSRLTATLLSLSLLAFVNACAQREFKGGTRNKVVKEADANSAVPELEKQDADANPSTPDLPKEPEDVIDSTDVELDRVISKLPDSIQDSFKASKTIKENFQFSLDLKSGSNDFKLTDINTAKSEKHNQITRSAVTDSFTQGTPGSAMKETFEQKGAKGLIDILVVIDDSGSMTEEQKNLSTKMNALLTSLKDTNWQIGIITTTVQANDKCILTLVKSTDSDAEAKFAKAVQAGLSGSGNEEGIRQAVNGLKCTEAPWVRADSSVAVLIVSDEDNCSLKGGDCPNSPGKTWTYLTNYVEKTISREIGKTAGFYGIFSPTVNSCKTAGNIGYHYEELLTYAAQKSNTTVSKIFGNICDADYSNTLNAISSNIALLLKNQFEISSAPDSGTLKLSVGGTAVPATDYKFSGKTITFNAGKEPANGKVLTAEYNVGAVPLFSKVTLNNTPAADTISVKVGNTVLASTAYTVSGKEITFKTQPASLAKIAIDYRVAAALKNAFQLEKTPISGSLKVLVDGKAASGMTYDAVANQVVLNPAPLDGLAIELNYSYRTGPQLRYSVATVQGAKNVKLFDGTKELTFTVVGSTYTILAADHKVDKVLTLKYDAPDGSDRIFTLPHTPDTGSAVLAVSTPTCNINSGIVISGANITARCSVTAKSDFLVEYSYTERVKSFTLEVPNPEVGRWEVFVDGSSSIDYVRSGNKITLNFEPKLDSRIDILYTLPE